MNSLIAIVPARAGSKGLLNKNIKLFCGIPLINITVNAALDSSIFHKIIVTTDSADIKDLYKDNVKLQLHDRSIKNASDSALMADVILEIVSDLNINDDATIMLLQPTSPLRNSKDIINAYDMYRNNNFESVISVSLPFSNPADCIPYKLPIEGGVDLLELHAKNRQNTQNMAYINGAIYLIKVQNFRIKKSFYTVNTGLYWMPKNRSIDIDDIDDFEFGELIWKKQRNHINH